MTDFSARDDAMLAYLKSCAGKPTPLNREIAAHFGMSMGTAEASLYRVFRSGRASFSGTGHWRIIHIPGVGSTVPKKAKQVRKAVEPEVLPERVMNWSCPRCGARSGMCAHTAIALSSRDIPAWRAHA